MTLRKKTLIISVLITLLIISLINASTHFILLKNISNLEEKYCLENVRRASNAISNEKEAMISRVRDYAVWDDTYGYVQDHNQDYIATNFSATTFVNLHINFLVIVDSVGQVITASGFDPAKNEPVPVSAAMLNLISQNQLFQNADMSTEKAGIILVEERPVMLAFHPVLTSLEMGPANGMLIMGRYLDDEFAHQLSEVTQLSIQIGLMEHSNLGLELQTARHAQANDPSLSVKILGPQKIAGYKVLTDIFGNPALIVRTDMERDIYNQSYQTILSFIYVVFAGSTIFLIISYFLLDRQILSRITNLSKSVTQIRFTGKLVERVQVTGGDEISYLGGEINQMLQSLEIADDELRRSRDDLEKRVEDRTAELMTVNEALKFEISEREESQKALFEAYDEIQLILSSISSVLIGVDSDYVVTQWNHVAVKLFGLAVSDAVGKDFFALPIYWDWETFKRNVEVCTSENRKVRIDDFHLDNPNQSTRILGLTLTPLVQKNNNHAGFLLVGSDITERLQLEQQVGRTNKLEAIGQLAAGVAHEINTPTQLVGSNLRFLGQQIKPILDLIDRFYQLDEANINEAGMPATMHPMRKLASNAHLDFFRQEAPKAIEQSLEGIDRIAHIVSAMRYFMHPGSEKKELANLNQIIQNALSLSRNEWKNVAEITTDLDPELPAVECLPSELSQVILILVINAVQAIQDASEEEPERLGQISITSRHLNEMAEIRVSDSGIGIPEAIRNKVFDLFFTTKEVGRGTGQGLAIAYTIVVKKHQGTLEFESVPGSGTTFIIHIPLKAGSRDEKNSSS